MKTVIILWLIPGIMFMTSRLLTVYRKEAWDAITAIFQLAVIMVITLLTGPFLLLWWLYSTIEEGFGILPMVVFGISGGFHLYLRSRIGENIYAIGWLRVKKVYMKIYDDSVAKEYVHMDDEKHWSNLTFMPTDKWIKLDNRMLYITKWTLVSKPCEQTGGKS